jgi:hypothetical protein
MINNRPHFASLTMCRNILPEQYASDPHPSYMTDGRSLTPNGYLCSSPLLIVRRHRLNFHVVLRKLIPKLRAFSKCIQETPMVRFYSSIDADDKVLIRQMSCESAFHGIPHQSLPHIERRP